MSIVTPLDHIGSCAVTSVIINLSTSEEFFSQNVKNLQFLTHHSVNCHERTDAKDPHETPRPSLPKAVHFRVLSYKPCDGTQLQSLFTLLNLRTPSSAWGIQIKFSLFLLVIE